jgi:hypothetical protein
MDGTGACNLPYFANKLKVLEVKENKYCSVPFSGNIKKVKIGGTH